MSIGASASDSCSEIGCEDFDYYYDADGGDHFDQSPAPGSILCDPEYVEYSCLDRQQVEDLFDKIVKELIESIPQNNLKPELAKLLLHLNKWDVEQVRISLLNDSKRFLIENHIINDHSNHPQFRKPKITNNNYLPKNQIPGTSSIECTVCFELSNSSPLLHLDCGHGFCKSCWQMHIETQLQNGVSSHITCMNTNCSLICQKDFVLDLLKNQSCEIISKYEQTLFRDFVSSHPYLRLCLGSDCDKIIFCNTSKAHRVICSNCNIKFCFKCGSDYHAPASCEIIKKWLVKCADDSETANYISAHTKDCPNCNSCIEKNGGCNHMQCSKCRHHFCWMCFRDWKTHGSEYYECSRYKENPQIAQEANHLKARRALERYLHYYERFENHQKSLKMEEELRLRIKTKIDEKVHNHEGTWIDWQYLHDAATLLTKCRYTLQYTYPFAYYMESSSRKELFEYQQAQLEKEIEELSWKVERAEHTDRAELENQMHVAELKRRTLLQDFFN
ncbi:unnamed protein product [Meloidogyne enterolobii]|uniref:Uncharacterized protein n=1 Tax=Meloidogyne enterolobii TaxID=390850 RepID=A0ACB1A1N0_MELEN